jgi:5-(carboxyamino)imidazole ribonucleotide mutase
MAIGGGRNAGLMAVKILGAGDAALRNRLKKFMATLAAESRQRDVKLAATLKDFSSVP